MKTHSHIVTHQDDLNIQGFRAPMITSIGAVDTRSRRSRDMGVNDDYLPIGGTFIPQFVFLSPRTPRIGTSASRSTPSSAFSQADASPLSTHTGFAPPKSGTQVATVAMGALLFCSASLNVAQFVGSSRAAGAALGQAAAPGLGWGAAAPQTHAFARMEDPLQNGNCNNGLVHMCIDSASAASSATAASLGQAPAEVAPAVVPVTVATQVPGVDPAVAAAAVATAAAANDPASIAAADTDGVDTFVEAGVVPGQDAVVPAAGGARYCRKDTWLLSCLFYKADVNDELTDWKSVKQECDREPLCDGVNKYWTSDLWHISSSGEAPGCDDTLRDGYGTDASAFYKEGSPGWNVYTEDKSCHEVDEWGNPLP
mgnify:CR=1 FL=1